MAPLILFADAQVPESAMVNAGGSVVVLCRQSYLLVPSGVVSRQG